VGPLAQDFYEAFRLGEDDRYISTVDADGIALAAIQALRRQVKDLKNENNALRARLEALERHAITLPVSSAC